MSGGVDSSVAAHLLLQQGHEVVGVFMRHGEQSPVACESSEADNESLSTSLPIVNNRLDHKQGCCTAADAEDARRVADRLQIPFYALDLQAEFGRIMDYFVREYTAARTPNPCVMCNNWIKFGKLFDYASSIRADYVATGHYARLRPGPSGEEQSCRLHRGRDAGKDQSYVLFGIERRYLSRMLLPVGEFEKPEIRRLAAGLGLDVAGKPDSQEICFVTQGRYSDFVRTRQPSGGTGGQIVDTAGNVIGHHHGIEAFTIGQRKRLGVAVGEPRFVVQIDPATCRVVIGTREELGRRGLLASDCNWLIDPPQRPTRVLAQIRYNARPAAAVVEPLERGRLRLTFDEPQFGVAPGQAVVCYEGDRVIGGGWIDSTTIGDSEVRFPAVPPYTIPSP